MAKKLISQSYWNQKRLIGIWSCVQCSVASNDKAKTLRHIRLKNKQIMNESKINFPDETVPEVTPK